MGVPLYNFMAAFPDYVTSTYVNEAAGFAGVSIYGGGWRPKDDYSGSTLDYLRDEDLSTHAVSIDLAENHTQYDIDFGVVRGAKVDAIPDGNYSRGCQGRIISAMDADFSTVTADTGWVDIWGRVYPLGSLPSFHPSFWDGKLTEEDRASGYRMPFFHVYDDGVLRRYKRVMFRDPDNPDGFLRIPRDFAAGGWQSRFNLSYGRNIGYEFNTIAVEALGGSKSYEEMTPRRVVAGSFDLMPQDEAFAFPFEMQRQLQNSRQVFISLDPTDELRRHQISFLATIRQASPLEAAAVGMERTGFVFEEVL